MPCTDVACVIQIVLASQVKAILVNVFGGIVNCATVANGITNAYKTINLSIPVIVRLEGEHYREGAGCVDGSPTQYVYKHSDLFCVHIENQYQNRSWKFLCFILFIC